jgi:predicted MFS family arabinose efflux permease
MMRATLLAAAAATTLAALAPSIGWLTASRALAGAAFSAAIPASLVYVGDTVAADRRQREVTDLMAGVALGTAIATAGAGILAGTVGWRWPFVVTGLLALGLAGALRSLRPPTHARAGRPALAPLREVLTDRMALLVLVLAFTEGAVLLGAITFLPPAVEDTGVGPSVAGLVTGIYGVAVLVGATVTGRLSRRVPPARLIAAGATAAVAGCTVAAVSTSPAPALLACTLLGIAWASMHSTLQTWATDVVPSARATAVSLFAGSLFAGSAASAALAAGPASQGRWTVIFLFGALLTVPLGVVGSVARSGWHTAQTRRTA